MWKMDLFGIRSRFPPARGNSPPNLPLLSTRRTLTVGYQACGRQGKSISNFNRIVRVGDGSGSAACLGLGSAAAGFPVMITVILKASWPRGSACDSAKIFEHCRNLGSALPQNDYLKQLRNNHLRQGGRLKLCRKCRLAAMFEGGTSPCGGVAL